MDPLTITAAVTKVVAGCFSTAQSLTELRSKWKLTSLTVGALCTEVAIISASLSQILTILESPDHEASAERALLRPELLNAFDIALTGCAVVLSFIDFEVDSIRKCTPGIDLEWKEKVKALWNEETMKELTRQLRGQYTAMGLLIQTLQMTSLADIKATLNKNSALLDKIAADTKTLRDSPGRSVVPGDRFSIITGDFLDELDRRSMSANSGLAFDFDHLVINSEVYRRAFRQFVNPVQKSQNVVRTSEFPEGDLIDLSASDDCHQISQLANQSMVTILDDLRSLEPEVILDQPAASHLSPTGSCGSSLTLDATMDNTTGEINGLVKDIEEEEICEDALSDLREQLVATIQNFEEDRTLLESTGITPVQIVEIPVECLPATDEVGRINSGALDVLVNGTTNSSDAAITPRENAAHCSITTGKSNTDRRIDGNTRKPRNISFNKRIQFLEVWSSSEYDRRGPIATCNRLTPMLAQQIKEELNNYKMEMDVHEESKPYTHFF